MKLYLYYLNIHNELFSKFEKIFDIMEYYELPFFDKSNIYQYSNYGLIALYAYTNKKDIDKLFIEERNKKYFVKEVKDISKEDYKKFKENNDDRELLIHRIKDSNNKYIKVIAPNTEISYIQDGYKEDIIDLFAKIPNLDVLNDEYVQLLSDLGILDIQNSYPDFPESINIRELDFYINTFGILYDRRF